MTEAASTSAEETPETGTRNRRRRLVALGVVAAIVAGVGAMLSGVPREVTVVYDLGELRDGLTALRVRYEAEGALIERVEWSYAAGEAPARLEHTARLPEGGMDAHISVKLGDAEFSEVRQLGAVGGDRIVLYLHPKE